MCVKPSNNFKAGISGLFINIASELIMIARDTIALVFSLSSNMVDFCDEIIAQHEDKIR